MSIPMPRCCARPTGCTLIYVLLQQAKEVLKPDATAIYVAAGQATKAIEEAIDAEIPLIVAVAEHIPLHDMLRVGRRC